MFYFYLLQPESRRSCEALAASFNQPFNNFSSQQPIPLMKMAFQRRFGQLLIKGMAGLPLLNSGTDL